MTAIREPKDGTELVPKNISTQLQPRQLKLYRGLVDLRFPPDSLKRIIRVNYEKCYFLRLPTELRIQVYRILIGAKHLHITPTDGSEGMRVTQGKRLSGRTHYLVAARSFPCAGGILERHRFSPIWRVCRQIYLEASIFLYTDNVFSFQSTWVATSFFNTLQPAQREALRIVGFPGLKEFYSLRLPCLKRLTGLKRVELQRTARELDHAVKKLAAALPGNTIEVVYLSELTITEVRESRRRARYWI